MDLLFAGLAVADFPRALEWYARFFGRDPDVVVHDREVMWRVAGSGWLYVVEDAARAGRGLVAISVSDLVEEVARLAAQGIDDGGIRPEGDAAQKAVVTDPEGNVIALLEVTEP
jgi:catechol 2,3-dioxygenase-like lactoylglutathione lyase family enzyme